MILDFKAEDNSIINIETLFVGGGPSTLWAITNYIKSGKINELISDKDNKSSIAIIERSSSFGGGALLDYGIRSNTSAKGFIRVIEKRIVDPNNKISSKKAKGDDIIVEKLQK